MQAIIYAVAIFFVVVGIVLLLNRPRRVVIDGSLPADFPAHGFSHAAFEDLLGTYVSPNGDIDYNSWQASPAAVARLNSYLVAVSSISPVSAPERFPDRNAELAYWMYGYNAYVIKSVIDHWPIAAVTDVRAPLETVKGLGFFYRQRFAFGGVFLSLLAVENGIIRKRYRDPRIHFVLSCASHSCPIVRPELPVGDELDTLLARAAVDFIVDPGNVAVDHEARKIVLSKIFKWYRKDFVNHARLHGIPHAEDALDYIQSIAPTSLARELALAIDYSVVYRDFDWSLNAA